jgi:hypothetical protein
MNKYNIDLSCQKLLLKGRMINNDSIISSLDIKPEDTFILFIFTKKKKKMITDNTETDNVDTNTDNVDTNTDNVDTNTDNVDTNTDNVDTNTDNVDTNNEDIKNEDYDHTCNNVDESNNDVTRNSNLDSVINGNNDDGDDSVNDASYISDKETKDDENTQLSNNTITDEITYFVEDDTHTSVNEDLYNLEYTIDESVNDNLNYDSDDNDDSILSISTDNDNDEDNHIEQVPNNTPTNENINDAPNTSITISNVIDSLNNNTTSNMDLLSSIQNNIMDNIHSDPQFIANLSSNDLSQIINNHILEQDINLDTPENALDSLVDIINNNPLITRYLGSNHPNNAENVNNTSYIIDKELIEYGETFLSIIEKSPDILGIWVKSQETNDLFDICISKIEIFDTKLADYISNNNDNFFQYIYEKMNNIKPGTTKRSDIFKSKNIEIRQELQTIFQNVINTQLNNNSNYQNNDSNEETSIRASVQIEPIEINEEHNNLIDKILEIFPHLSRTSIYIALQVNDFNEDMAINYLFDFHE